MADNLHESLSALMDDEADDLELRRLLKTLESHDAEGDAAELQAKWHRYHVVSASLSQEVHCAPSRNLLASIQAELAEDAVPSRSLATAVAGHKVFRFMGQSAVAASVALAVLFTADLAMVADNGAGDETAAQLAVGEPVSSQLPPFTGDLNPETATRVAVQKELDPEEMSRLERVVSAELEDALEVPATFNPQDNNR